MFRSTCLALAFLGNAAFAQETGAPDAPEGAAPVAPSQILAVDRDMLFSQSMYGQRILAELEKERARLASEARRVEAALLAEEQNLTEQRDKLTPEAFRVLADSFDEKVQALRNERPRQEQEFTRRFEQERSAYFEKIGPILGQVVRARGGVMIVDRRAILLTTQPIDITDQAIARINQVLGDGVNTPDAAPSGDAVAPDPALPDGAAPDEKQP